MKPTGVELIHEERFEQISKHQRSIEDDVKNNSLGQLSFAARILAQQTTPYELDHTVIPRGWDYEIWNRMLNKPYKQRLIIAGALIAAEIDRITATEGE